MSEADRTPPSAAGHLEPYGARVTLRPGARELDVRRFVTSLVEDLAASCLASGASVIGHVKCLLRARDGVLTCNLTSVRLGVSLGGLSGLPVVAGVQPDDEAELEMAVLVYDLPAGAIDSLLAEALMSLLDPLQVSWSKQAYFDRR